MFYKLILFFLLLSVSLFGRQYTLEECLSSAVLNSGYTKQELNYNKISEIELNELFSNYYPQFNIDAQATYQSDVFALPIKLPTLTIPSLRQDQYNINLNLQQLIYDGGTISESEKLSKLSAEANKENSKIKIRNIIEQVGALYYSALRVKMTMESIKSTITTLEINRKQISSLVGNGVLVRSNIDAVEIQISSKKQLLQSMNDDYKSLIKSINSIAMLENFTDVILSEIPEKSANDYTINRSEINSFDVYSDINKQKISTSKTQNMPKLSAFAKFGFGNPNQFNMFEQEWSEYYIVGLKMIWKPFDWFSSDRNSEIAEMQNQNLQIEKTEFMKQLNIQLDKENSELEKVKTMLEQDKTIFDLQMKIMMDKLTQVLGGTATISEYINEVNSLLQYEINMNLHKIMLENAKSNILIKSGNYKVISK
jgi:outer membrane protein TolC